MTSGTEQDRKVRSAISAAISHLETIESGLDPVDSEKNREVRRRLGDNLEGLRERDDGLRTDGAGAVCDLCGHAIEPATDRETHICRTCLREEVQVGDRVATDGGTPETGSDRPGWVCTGCGKHVSGTIPVDVCADCGGEWVEATPDRLACEGCGADDASRVLNSEHNRLCEDCIRRENSIPVDALEELRKEWVQAARESTSGRALGLETAADELRVLVEEHKGLPEEEDGPELVTDGGTKRFWEDPVPPSQSGPNTAQCDLEFCQGCGMSMDPTHMGYYVDTNDLGPDAEGGTAVVFRNDVEETYGQEWLGFEEEDIGAWCNSCSWKLQRKRSAKVATDGGTSSTGIVHICRRCDRRVAYPDTGLCIRCSEQDGGLRADVVADVRNLPLECSPDLLTMSPPCTDFARWMLPWLDEPNPSTELVEACLRVVEDLEPDWWVLENSRGLSMYWREAAQNVGPYYLWGNLPAIDVTLTDGGKMSVSGKTPEERAKVPYELADAVRGAVEEQRKLVTDGGSPESDTEQYEAEPHRCEECGTVVRVGVIEENDFGAYCDCTLENGRPVKHMSGYPYPDRWSKSKPKETFSWEDLQGAQLEFQRDTLDHVPHNVTDTDAQAGVRAFLNLLEEPNRSVDTGGDSP